MQQLSVHPTRSESIQCMKYWSCGRRWYIMVAVPNSCSHSAMMSTWLTVKRLKINCPVQRFDSTNINLPDLQIFTVIYLHGWLQIYSQHSKACRQIKRGERLVPKRRSSCPVGWRTKKAKPYKFKYEAFKWFKLFGHRWCFRHYWLPETEPFVSISRSGSYMATESHSLRSKDMVFSLALSLRQNTPACSLAHPKQAWSTILNF